MPKAAGSDQVFKRVNKLIRDQGYRALRGINQNKDLPLDEYVEIFHNELIALTPYSLIAS